MNTYPYYLVRTGSTEVYHCIEKMTGIKSGYNTGRVCIVRIEDDETKTAFELAFGDRIIKVVTK